MSPSSEGTEIDDSNAQTKRQTNENAQRKQEELLPTSTLEDWEKSETKMKNEELETSSDSDESDVANSSNDDDDEEETLNKDVRTVVDTKEQEEIIHSVFNKSALTLTT